MPDRRHFRPQKPSNHIHWDWKLSLCRRPPYLDDRTIPQTPIQLRILALQPLDLGLSLGSPSDVAKRDGDRPAFYQRSGDCPVSKLGGAEFDWGGGGGGDGVSGQTVGVYGRVSENDSASDVRFGRGVFEGIVGDLEVD